MSSSTRDLRLDFFRGLSLLLIFIGHIPANGFARFTLSTFVFNDAAEVFIFISGYTSALVFYRRAANNGNTNAVIQLLQRCWTLYIAHILLFVVYFALVTYVGERFSLPSLVLEARLDNVLENPPTAIFNALLLRYQPHHLDILPLYIVALAAFAVLLPLLNRYLHAVLIASLSLYLVVTIFNVHVPAHPEGQHWFFNPLAWQVLFVIGAVCASKAGANFLTWFYGKWALRGAVVVLIGCLIVYRLIKLWPDMLPLWLAYGTQQLEYKTTLGPARLINFLALAIVVTHFIPKASPLLHMSLARPLILCGKNSLYIFCLGIPLAFVGRVILITVGTDWWVHVVVAGGGIAILVTTATVIEWAKDRTRRTAQPAPATIDG